MRAKMPLMERIFLGDTLLIFDGYIYNNLKLTCLSKRLVSL